MRSDLNKSAGFRDLDRLFRHGTVPPGDRALLEWFLDGGEESAFEALLDRHGPMVMGVCRRLLASPHDADDAFQATFLVLIRKAKGLRDADRLGPWLHGVATRVAGKARARSARHRGRHKGYVADLPGPGDASTDWLDVRPILDAELGRIPAKMRDVLVLCLLEGATAEEAARRLACPLGTVKSRLARGRNALRVRLTGRGVAPSVALAATSHVFSSHASAALLRTTLGLVAASSASIAPGVIALTRGVAPAMLTKSTLAVSVMLGGLVLTGLGTALWNPPAMGQAPGAAGPVGAEEQQTIDHMKMTLLALHNYAASQNHFPPAAFYGQDGEPKLSWRVALLPYLGETGLYNAFNRDEPWDSPTNKPLIARMPAAFETPSSPTKPGETRIRGFAGKGAFFEGKQGTMLSEITDGTSNTLTIALAEEPVSWTKPGDLLFVEGQPLPSLDPNDPKGYPIGLADGSVLVMRKGDDALLRDLITRAGGEVIALDSITRAGGGSITQAVGKIADSSPRDPNKARDAGVVLLPPLTRQALDEGPGMMGSMDMTGMFVTKATKGGMNATTKGIDPAEKRLRTVEEKLDLILKRLDATTGTAPPVQP
jgi:RNA polymerase sigma factor (sigma-70 family)